MMAPRRIDVIKKAVEGRIKAGPVSVLGDPVKFHPPQIMTGEAAKKGQLFDLLRIPTIGALVSKCEDPFRGEHARAVPINRGERRRDEKGTIAACNARHHIPPPCLLEAAQSFKEDEQDGHRPQ